MDLLKKSLVDELKVLGKDFLKKHTETLDDQKRALREQIEMEKKRKIKILEEDAQHFLNHLDKTYEKLNEHSSKLAFDLASVKFNGELLVNESKSTKVATDTFAAFKKKLQDKIKNFKIVNIKFQPTNESNENSLGRLKEENVIGNDIAELYRQVTSHLEQNGIIIKSPFRSS